MLKTFIVAFLLQSFAMPPRTGLVNPSSLTPVPKKLQKDYDKLWTRFVKAKPKDDPKIVKDADKLLKKNPNLSQLVLMEAYIDLYNNKVGDAEARMERVLSADPRNKVVLSYLAEFSFAREDYTRAGELYSRLLEADPSRTDVEPKRQKALLLTEEDLIRRASRAEMENRAEEAESLYTQALRMAPNEPSLHGRLGDLYAREKKYDKAIAEFQKEREFGGSADDVDRRMAEALLGQGKTEEARVILENLKKSGTHDGALEAKVSELENLGRWGGDLPTFRKIQAAPELTREQLSTMIVRYFPQISDLRRTPQVATDIQNSPARAEIQMVMAVGLIDPLPNHTFQPSAPVTRGDLARVFARLTRLLGLQPTAAPAIPISDLASSNPLYREVQLVLSFGLLSLDDTGGFSPDAHVSGESSVAAIEKLLQLFRRIFQQLEA